MTSRAVPNPIPNLSHIPNPNPTPNPNPIPTPGTLKSVWAALDADRSGYITAGEFGKFMKLGTPETYQVPMLTLTPTQT